MVGKPEYCKLKKEIFLKVFDCESRKIAPLFTNNKLDHLDSDFLTTMKKIDQAIIAFRRSHAFGFAMGGSARRVGRGSGARKSVG